MVCDRVFVAVLACGKDHWNFSILLYELRLLGEPRSLEYLVIYLFSAILFIFFLKDPFGTYHFDIRARPEIDDEHSHGLSGGFR